MFQVTFIVMTSHWIFLISLLVVSFFLLFGLSTILQKKISSTFLRMRRMCTLTTFRRWASTEMFLRWLLIRKRKSALAPSPTALSVK